MLFYAVSRAIFTPMSADLFCFMPPLLPAVSFELGGFPYSFSQNLEMQKKKPQFSCGFDKSMIYCLCAFAEFIGCVYVCVCTYTQGMLFPATSPPAPFYRSATRGIVLTHCRYPIGFFERILKNCLPLSGPAFKHAGFDTKQKRFGKIAQYP